jgi:hypothetical protein
LSPTGGDEGLVELPQAGRSPVASYIWPLFYRYVNMNGVIFMVDADKVLGEMI